jgi:hypothetical protein
MDRIKGLVVTLDQDYKDEDIKSLIDAINMIKGVTNVDLVGSNIDDIINRNRIKNEFQDKLNKMFY